MWPIIKSFMTDVPIIQKLVHWFAHATGLFLHQPKNIKDPFLMLYSVTKETNQMG